MFILKLFNQSTKKKTTCFWIIYLLFVIEILYVQLDDTMQIYKVIPLIIFSMPGSGKQDLLHALKRFLQFLKQAGLRRIFPVLHGFKQDFRRSTQLQKQRIIGNVVGQASKQMTDNPNKRASTISFILETWKKKDLKLLMYQLSNQGVYCFY